jgi:hypothetical protein
MGERELRIDGVDDGAQGLSHLILEWFATVFKCKFQKLRLDRLKRMDHQPEPSCSEPLKIFVKNISRLAKRSRSSHRGGSGSNSTVLVKCAMIRQ